MGIYNMLNNYKHDKEISKAEEIFLKQKEAIMSLKGTSGLKEIVAYWTRQKEINENSFGNTGDNTHFALYKQSQQFLKFIENLSS